MPEFIFTMHRLTRVHPPDKEVLKDITLAFYPGAKIGVLGPNGSGKSTLLRVMAGVDTEFRGDAQLAAGSTVGLLEQEPQLDEGKDVRGNVEDGVRPLRDMLDRFNELSANYSDETADEFAALQEKIDAADAWNLDTLLDTAMDALRLPPSDADVTTLSGGERRRVALCRLLLAQPDLLLLDEPTNHLDAESVAWLERHLHDYPGTIVAVTHDRYFLDNVAGWILELDRGRGLPFQGNYSSWLEQKQARLAQEEKQESARQRTLARELEWTRMNASSRLTKNKARLARYDALLAEERNVKLDNVEIHIPAGPRLGEVVVEAEGVSKAYGDRLLFEDLTFKLPPAGIVGVIGGNGAGKTTLLRVIAGLQPIDAGRILVDGAAIDHLPPHRRGIAMVFQEPRLLGHLDVLDNVALPLRAAGMRRAARRRIAAERLAEVGLGGLAHRRVQGLSGGEQQRVSLARALSADPALLLLDEPLAALDPNRRSELRRVICDLQEQRRLTTLTVTHDHSEAAELGRRIALMLDGRIVQHGEPRALFERPVSAAVARFFGVANVLGYRGGTLAIRPEHVRLDALAGELRGVVLEAVYAGDHVRVIIDCDGRRIQAHVAPGEAPRVGEPTGVRFPPEHVWRLPSSSAAAEEATPT